MAFLGPLPDLHLHYARDKDSVSLLLATPVYWGVLDTNMQISHLTVLTTGTSATFIAPSSEVHQDCHCLRIAFYLHIDQGFVTLLNLPSKSLTESIQMVTHLLYFFSSIFYKLLWLTYSSTLTRIPQRFHFTSVTWKPLTCVWINAEAQGSSIAVHEPVLHLPVNAEVCIVGFHLQHVRPWRLVLQNPGAITVVSALKINPKSSPMYYTEPHELAALWQHIGKLKRKSLLLHIVTKKSSSKGERGWKKENEDFALYA